MPGQKRTGIFKHNCSRSREREKPQCKSCCMTIIERAAAPTPKFFKKLRNIGLILAAISTTIVTAPIALPAAVITIAGYLAVGSAVLGAVSQVTITDREE